jgi:ATP-dependent RNA helicase RhlE
VSLAEVQIFVLDEADRMLDMGFIRDIRRVLKMLPQQRQNLMFSATYSDDIRQLANNFLRNPSALQVTPRNATADKVEQSAYRVPKDHKRHLLAHLINEGNWHQVLVFTRTKHGANRLTQQLERAGINAMAIHGNKSQNARVKALQDFKENRITALVATEVAARGLDIKELPHVVNYELPNVPEDYVHRIGRTARAGSTGAAVSLVSPDELSYLRDIEKLLKRKIDLLEPPKFEIKEGSHPPRSQQAADGAPREYQPHQDPRRRPEHRRGGRPNHSGGGRHGGRNPGAGRADHASYVPENHASRGDAQQGARPQGERSGGHRGGQHGGHHGGQQGRQGGNGGGGHGRKGGHEGNRGGRSGGRGGFARGARSGGNRGGGHSGGGQSGHGNGGGFSRMN